MVEQQLEDMLQTNLYNGFANAAGIMSLFEGLRNDPNAEKKLGIFVDLYLEEQKPNIQSLIQEVIDLQQSANENDAIWKALIQGIDAEDMQVFATKAMHSLKSDILDYFRKFLEYTDETNFED